MCESETQRMASLAVAVCLLIYAAIRFGIAQAFWEHGGFVGFSLALIWFGPALGQSTGGRITHSTPGIVVIAMGWLFLVLSGLLISIAEEQPTPLPW